MPGVFLSAVVFVLPPVVVVSFLQANANYAIAMVKIKSLFFILNSDSFLFINIKKTNRQYFLQNFITDLSIE